MTRLALIFAAVSTPVTAHEWYDAACCSGFDCAPVAVETVQSVPGGYLLTIEPGQHPLVFQRIEEFVSYDDADRFRASQDDQWHVCIFPAGKVRCVYQPEWDF